MMSIPALNDLPSWWLTIAGLFLGVLGTLSLAYDLLGRPRRVLPRVIWVGSSGGLVAGILVIDYLWLFGSGRDAGEVRGQALALAAVGFFMQHIFFTPPPEQPPPVFVWPKVLTPVVLGSLILWGGGAALALDSPEHLKGVLGLFFAVPGVLIIGALGGFSQAIQWWFFHLPKNRLAVIGILLITVGLALALTPLVVGILY
jgi:hypothetical protein